MKEAITAPSAPVPAGPYSHAVRAGDFVFVSGQVPRDAAGSYSPASVGEETRRTLTNLALIAQAAGGTLDDVVKVTAYLSDGDFFVEFNQVYGEFFTGTPPARTTVTAGLREVKVELDATLYLPVSRRLQDRRLHRSRQ